MNIFILANLTAAETGVDGAVMWVSAGEFSNAGAEQGPRVMVARGPRISRDRLEEAVVVRLSEPPEVLGGLAPEMERQVVAFVAQNRTVLLRYWDGAISTRELLDLLERRG
ncbi:MAG: hypothetical protein ACLQVI_20580 [Polyangiaceae bacterium]